MTVTQGVEESPHQYSRTCGLWSLWQYVWVGPQDTGHWEGERHRTCRTTEYWTVRHSSQECHYEPASCGLDPSGHPQTSFEPGTSGYYDTRYYVFHDGQCCRWHYNSNSFSACHSPEHPGGEVCTPRVYGDSQAYGHAFDEVETQRRIVSPIFLAVMRHLPTPLPRFEEVHRFAQALAGDAKQSDAPLDLPGLAISPVTRGESISFGLSGPMAIEGVEQYELTVDGESLAPEGPIETERLRPGDHLVSLIASAAEGKVRSSFILSVEEPIDLSFADDHMTLKYGATSRKYSVKATAVLTNRTPNDQSVTVSVLSSPPGWSADVEGTRSFLIGANGRQEVPIRLAITGPIALAKPVSTFVVAARLNRSDDRSRDIVATVAVNVTATPELMRVGAALAKGDERHLGETKTALFDADVAMSTRPATPKGASAGK